MADFRFGRFDVDLRARELKKDGVRLRLQDQPFELLLMLLEHPGDVLTRDELRARLWPNGTFVDFEHGLNAAVKRLRGTLGDNADRPRFIETLHRRGYRFIGRVENGSAGVTSRYDALESDTRKRLAVLPFSSVTEHSVPDSFAGGLTEELMTQLGRLCADKLGIIGRGSCMRVRRADQTVRSIGDTLRAHYLIDGSVRTEGDRVRVTAQLVETRGETQLWADSYERQLADCLTTQSEMAAAIVQAVAQELLPDQAVRRTSGTNQIAAYQSYLKGKYHWNRPGAEGLPEALAFFEQACALDPRFAAAHAAVGRLRAAAADYYAADPRVTLQAARTAATRALELDPSESQAYLTLAEVRRTLEWDWEGAEDEYRRALQFNPGNEGAMRLYGVFLAGQGRGRDARLMVDRARDLDPLCLVANTSAAWVRYVSREYDETVDFCRHTLDMDTGYPGTHRLLAAALVQLGQVDESIAQLESSPVTARDPASLACLAHAVGLKGQEGRAADILARIEPIAKGRYVSAYHVAIAYAGIGDVDAMFTALDRACDDRDPAIMNVVVEPRFDGVRGDPRYTGLVERLNLS